VKDNRPVNLDIGTIRLPVTAYVSITHRVSGVIMVVASFILLWALDASLSGPSGFEAIADLLASPIVKFIAWGIATALLYHSVAGVRHLIMDFGVGETLEGGILGARLVFAITVLGAIILGVALW